MDFSPELPSPPDPMEQLLEYNPSSFMGGSSQGINSTRKTYIDLYYNTRLKTFHYIRPGALMRSWKVLFPVKYVYYRKLWNRFRLKLLKVLVKYGNVSPYIYMDVIGTSKNWKTNRFKLDFIGTNRTKYTLTADFSGHPKLSISIRS